MLGSRIAALRRNANMSQAELAQLLKISASAVGMYEQGRREPSLNTVVEMASVFEVSTDFLLTGSVRSEQEAMRIVALLEATLERVEARMATRQSRVFSRQELAMLIAAMLIEP